MYRTDHNETKVWYKFQISRCSFTGGSPVANSRRRACIARSHWPSRRRCHMTELRGMMGRTDRDFATWRWSEGEVAGAVPSENVFFLVARSSDPVVTSQSRVTVEIRVQVLGIGRVPAALARINMRETAGSATTKVTPRGIVCRSSTYGRD